jgi:Sigma-54 interaction domain
MPKSPHEAEEGPMASRSHGTPRHFDVTLVSLPPAAAVSSAVTVSTLAALEFNALPDSVLLSWLGPSKHGTNVLIQCSRDTEGATLAHVLTWSPRPVTVCLLPGALSLPEAGGVLVLNDAGALTKRQQVQLYDHLSLSFGRTQVISLTTASLPSLVADGAFLESLYYRLNMIRVDATHGTRPSPFALTQGAQEHSLQ